MAPIRHGHTIGGHRSPTYVSWISMLARCNRPAHPRYSDYGGRGIRVCDRWRHADGFAHFLADLGARPPGLTLDRIDPDGNYEPGNVRWATLLQQRWNRRDMIAAHQAADWETVDPTGPEPVSGMPF